MLFYTLALLEIFKKKQSYILTMEVIMRPRLDNSQFALVLATQIGPGMGICAQVSQSEFSPRIFLLETIRISFLPDHEAQIRTHQNFQQPCP